MSEAKDFLEMVREKRRKVRRMEEALAENTARAESVTGLAFTERVQTSNKYTIDATLAALEEERQKLVDAQNELEDMTERAGKSKGQKGGGMMDIVMGFIIGTFAGSIVVTFTLRLFFVNAKWRDE